MSIRRMLMRQAGLVALAGSLAACAPLVQSHGYMPERSELDTLIVGADTQATVEDVVGRPQDTGLGGDETWYYVENVVSTFLFFAPEVQERNVLALDFDGDGVLSGMSRYGLEDGQVIDLVTRITPTDRRRRSILNRIFGNVGSIAPPIPG